MIKTLKPMLISGKEVLPLIEGGKGINSTDGLSSGAWANENCVGTFSGITPDYYDSFGKFVREKYLKVSRKDRHQEMIDQAIEGCVAQAKIAHEASNGNGRIHVNMLWEAGGAQEILIGMLEKAKGLIHGVTCGAGLPYKLGEIATKYKVYYYPIVSSARAFQVLWKRAYSNCSEYLGGVVYEDPWLAGGHNGLSNAEDPLKPETPYQRLVELRKFLTSINLKDLPIILAGGIWNLKDFENYIDNPELGNVAFQFGTRPMITQESPVSKAWQSVMRTVKKGDVVLQKFSPTGFFSSAIKNTFLEALTRRTEGQIAFSKEENAEFSQPLDVSETKTLFIRPQDMKKAQLQLDQGYTEIKETPDETVVFLNKAEWEEMKEDRKNCIGCLSQCQFSSWSQASGSTGRIPDPRSYCIHKTLYEIGHGGSVKDHLLFAGHQVYRFATDPLYRDGHLPSVKELIEKIRIGE